MALSLETYSAIGPANSSTSEQFSNSYLEVQQFTLLPKSLFVTVVASDAKGRSPLSWEPKSTVPQSQDSAQVIFTVS
jgi:hypothetical protein